MTSNISEGRQQIPSSITSPNSFIELLPGSGHRHNWGVHRLKVHAKCVLFVNKRDEMRKTWVLCQNTNLMEEDGWCCFLSQKLSLFNSAGPHVTAVASVAAAFQPPSDRDVVRSVVLESQERKNEESSFPDKNIKKRRRSSVPDCLRNNFPKFLAFFYILEA